MMFDNLPILTNSPDPRPISSFQGFSPELRQLIRYYSDDYMSKCLGISIQEHRYLDIKSYINKEIKEEMSRKRSEPLDNSNISLPDGKYLWCTINWDPKTFDLEKVKVILSELFDHKYFVQYACNYEQRGKVEKERGIGIHNHLLIKTGSNVAPSYVKRLIVRKLKGLIGNPRHVDLRKTDFEKDKMLYLSGDKMHLYKDCMIVQDKLWREENNLLSIYTNFLNWKI